MAGQVVEWLFTARQGWCPTWWVPAFVVRPRPKRVGIAAKMADGRWVPRWVTRERLRWKRDIEPR